MCLSISDFFAEYLDFFTMDGKIEKSHGGGPPGPRGSAPASVRRSSGPAAQTCVFFFNFTIHREKVKISAKKSEISGQIQTISPKNVVICIIGNILKKSK